MPDLDNFDPRRVERHFLQPEDHETISKTDLAYPGGPEFNFSTMPPRPLRKKDPQQLRIFKFPYDYPIELYSFKIPGLGEKGRLCGHQRMSHFSSDGTAVRYGLLRCKRVECPACWNDWARHLVFHLALCVEAQAWCTGKRPYAVVLSVPPSEVNEKWKWERINTSLFRRGYRRLREHAGVNGGVMVFHPYRIKTGWQYAFRRKGIHQDVGMWKVIRERVQKGEPLYKFVKLGPHAHAIVFGEPEAHECKDYVIKFHDEDNLPIVLELEDVIAFLRYLISHTGVLNHLAEYRRHTVKKEYRRPGSATTTVRHRQTHTIREFGALFRIDPRALLPPDVFDALATEIAGRLGMVWENGALSYPAYPQELATSELQPEWIPIHQLGVYLDCEAWITSLGMNLTYYWSHVWHFIKTMGRPPDFADGEGEVKHPAELLVFAETKPTQPGLAPCKELATSKVLAVELGLLDHGPWVLAPGDRAALDALSIRAIGQPFPVQGEVAPCAHLPLPRS